MLQQLRSELLAISNPQKAKILSGFFKTGKGQYGEKDVFLGVMVPQSRAIAAKYTSLSFEDISKLLHSKFHEERLIALLMLVKKFGHSPEIQKEVYDFYLQNTAFINNWDLVDLTAPKIVGEYLLNRDRKILTKLARSKDLWERRIAVMATFQFICKNREYEDTFRIAEILILDTHDLIQKAVGWMLREVGKRVSEKAEREFLDRNYKKMGRTALRYAIERFDPELRQKYLKGVV